MISNRMNEVNEMPRIQFGGTNGPERQNLCLTIEQRFHELLTWLHQISSKILNVRQSTWYDDMAFFRCEVRKLELMIENLIEKAFKEVGNIEEAVQTLHAFRYFMYRENLQRQFDDKTSLVTFVLFNFYYFLFTDKILLNLIFKRNKNLKGSLIRIILHLNIIKK